MRNLYIAQFKQDATGYLTTTYHWGLFLAEGDASSSGTLHHSVYSYNESASQARQTFHDCTRHVGINTGAYDYGYLQIERPQGISGRGNCMRVVFVAAVNLSDNYLRSVCLAIARQYPYNVHSNNCQNFVLRVLRTLIDDQVITQQQYDDAVSRLLPSMFADTEMPDPDLAYGEYHPGERAQRGPRSGPRAPPSYGGRAPASSSTSDGRPRASGSGSHGRAPASSSTSNGRPRASASSSDGRPRASASSSDGRPRASGPGSYGRAQGSGSGSGSRHRFLD